MKRHLTQSTAVTRKHKAMGGSYLLCYIVDHAVAFGQTVAICTRLMQHGEGIPLLSVEHFINDLRYGMGRRCGPGHDC